MTKTSTRYSPEMRERAVRLVLDHQQDHPSQWAAIQSIAPKIGCSTETLRNWVRRAERDAGQRAGPAGDDLLRLKALERENRELRRADGILRPHAFLGHPHFSPGRSPKSGVGAP